MQRLVSAFVLVLVMFMAPFAILPATATGDLDLHIVIIGYEKTTGPTTVAKMHAP